jgi:hypothetical protein
MFKNPFKKPTRTSQEHLLLSTPHFMRKSSTSTHEATLAECKADALTS